MVLDPSRAEFEHEKDINVESLLATIMGLNQIQYGEPVPTESLLPAVGEPYEAHRAIDTNWVWIWNDITSVWERMDVFMQNYWNSTAFGNDKGFFIDEAALVLAYPVGQDGWFATVGDTDTVWVWDSNTASWVNSGIAPSYATQLEQEGGVVNNKASSPSTTNPSNFTARATPITGTETFVTGDGVDVKSRNVQEVIDAAVLSSNIALGPTEAVVTKGGNDLTGMVGYFVPFLTVQAAIDAGAEFVHVFAGTYIGDITLLDDQFVSILLYGGGLSSCHVTLGEFATIVIKDVNGGSAFGGNFTGGDGAYVFLDGMYTLFNLYSPMPFITGCSAIFISNVRKTVSSSSKFWDATYDFILLNIDNCEYINCSSSGDIIDQSGVFGDIIIRNVGQINCRSVAPSMEELFNTTIQSSNINCSGTAFTVNSLAPDGVNFDIQNSSIRSSGGYFISGSGTAVSNVTSYGSTITSSKANLINWSGPVGTRVNLKTQSRINKPWDVAGYVNFVVDDDFENVNI